MESVEEKKSGEHLTEVEMREAEAHRGFVREMDQTLGKAYGMGGAAVVAVLMMVVVAGWFFGLLTQLILWVPGVTAALLTLYLARRGIYARRDRLRERVERYCEANELPPRVLREYYTAEDLYPFFAAIYEETPRRLVAKGPQAEHSG